MMQQQQVALQQVVQQAAQAIEDKLDEEIDQLTNIGDKDIVGLRKQRIKQLKENKAKQQVWLQQGHGEYTEIEEQDLIKKHQKVERLVAHFYRSNLFCQVVDKALIELCKKHIETKFVKLSAEKNLYLADTWNIKQLPTLVMIKNGKVAYYIRGLGEFEQFINTSQFPLAIEQYLIQQDMAFDSDQGQENRAPADPEGSETQNRIVRKGIYSQKTESDEDSDFE